LSREFELVLYQHGRRSYGIEENVKRAVKKLGELRIDSQGIAVFPEMWFGRSS